MAARILFIAENPHEQRESALLVSIYIVRQDILSFVSESGITSFDTWGGHAMMLEALSLKGETSQVEVNQDLHELCRRYGARLRNESTDYFPSTRGIMMMITCALSLQQWTSRRCGAEHMHQFYHDAGEEAKVMRPYRLYVHHTAPHSTAVIEYPCYMHISIDLHL
jgi:hypothetical protein